MWYYEREEQRWHVFSYVNNKLLTQTGMQPVETLESVQMVRASDSVQVELTVGSSEELLNQLEFTSFVLR